MYRDQLEGERPHAVCIPFPSQGHISVMLNTAKILHHHDFHITFLLTPSNYNHIAKSTNQFVPSFPPTFRFETIPDGLPPRESPDTALNISKVCFSTATGCGVPFREIIHKLNAAAAAASEDDGVGVGGCRPVSCIVSDVFMPFTVGAAEELGVPVVMLWPFCAAATMLHLHSPHIRDQLNKHKDAISGDHILDEIPGLKSIRLRDIPSSFWSTDPNDPFIEYLFSVVSTSYKATAVIIHTFDELEPELCNALSSMYNNRVYTIGPIPLLLKNGFPQSETIDKIGCQFWKQDQNCIEWLDSKDPKSVVYVNFGSLTITTFEKLQEFAMGLLNSMHNFLWIIRPELISGCSGTTLPPECMDQVAGRGYIAGWCDQERVLNHPSVGGFLTHCGWNSVVESMSAGVAMICWPVLADQPLNRYCCCSQWGVGIELENDVKRENVECVVRDFMEGEKGKEVKRKAMFWKERAMGATSFGGSSFLNLEKLIGEVMLRSGR